MTATAHALRQARMEFKTTTDMKELLSQAAALDGLDLTSFVLGSAIEKARQVLSQHTSIALAREGQASLARLLAQPSQPSAAMQELMRLPDLPSRKA